MVETTPVPVLVDEKKVTVEVVVEELGDSVLATDELQGTEEVAVSVKVEVVMLRMA